MTRNATLVVLAMLSIVCVPAFASAGAVKAAALVKASGVPDSTALHLTFTNDTAALASLDQTWEGARGDEMRQSLDAYFGNGDGKLSASEIAHIAAAASKDMLTKAWDPLAIDGVSAHVSMVVVTMDGAEGNQTRTPLVIHHAITLAIPPLSGGNHSFALASTWNGTYTIEPPTGLAVNGASTSAPVTGVLASGTSVAFTLAPPVAVAPPPATSTPTVASPTESVATTPSPVGPVLPAKRGIPAPAMLASALAIALAALLVARRRR